MFVRRMARSFHLPEDVSLRRVVLRAFVLWLPATLLICLLLYYRFQSEQEVLRQEIERSAVVELETLGESIQQHVETSVGDALLLASIPEVETCLESDGRNCREALHVFGALPASGRPYDQARLICLEGRERLRVEFRHGVEVTASSNLQDKSHRYYVQQGAVLPQGRVYISPLDLNMEHGRIEDPHRPMLRFVAPVFSQGERLGMLVLNLNAAELLRLVLDTATDERLSIQMTNDDGYWLVHPNPARLWGFMLPDREHHRLQNEQPALWEAMRGNRVASVELEETIFVTRQVSLDYRTAQTTDRWYLLEGVNRADLASSVSGSVLRLVGIGTVLSLMLAGGCLLLALSEEHRRAALGFVRKQNEKLVNQGQRLLEERTFYRELFEANKAVFLLLDESGNIVDASHSAGEYYGYGRERLMQMRYRELALISPEDFEKGLKRSLSSEGHSAHRQHVLANGDIREVEVFAGPVRRDNQKLIFLIVQDVTEAVMAQNELRENQQRLMAVTESANDAVIIIDPWERVAYWNSAAQSMFGYTAHEALGHDLHTLVVPDDLLKEAQEGHKQFVTSDTGHIRHPLKEFRAKHKDGSTFPVERSLAAFHFKGQWWAAGNVRDISERKEAERKLRELATTDALTGLANRRHFYEQFESELNRAQRYGHDLALLMFDVDHFKSINDTKGHDAGDEVLRALSDLAMETFRDVDVVARVGGEEFCVLLPESSLESARIAAERFRVAVENMVVHTAAGDVRLTVSLGLTIHEKGESDPDTLMKCADIALYRAKSGGRNRVAVNPPGNGGTASEEQETDGPDIDDPNAGGPTEGSS